MNTEKESGQIICDDRQENSVVRFLFEKHGVRGEIMHMREPCVKLLQHHDYPACVNALMLELAGSAVMLAATLKIDGTITVQLMGGRGESALRFAFVNIDRSLDFYGSASLIEGNDYEGEKNLKELAGEGAALVISVFPQDGTRYQGYVPLEKDTLSGALEDYFRSSEQLPTSFRLLRDETRRSVSGIMLQIIPDIEGNTDSLEHLSILADTMTADELENLSLHECLLRLYRREQIRVFDAESVDFKCTCSKERYLTTIRAMKHEDVAELAGDPDGLVLTCNNCGAVYTVSQREMRELLKEKELSDRKARGDETETVISDE